MNMTAKEIFKKMGYSYSYDGFTIQYQKEEGFGFRSHVLFTDNKKVHVYYYEPDFVPERDFAFPRSIDMELLEAINEQVKELGWTNE